jgi:hypothetical protein
MGLEAINMQSNCCKAFQKKLAKDKRKTREAELELMRDIDSEYISITDKKVRSESPLDKHSLLAQSAPKIEMMKIEL